MTPCCHAALSSWPTTWLTRLRLRQDRVAAVSFVVMCQSFMAIDLIVLFPIERSIYLRDQVGSGAGPSV